MKDEIIEQLIDTKLWQLRPKLMFDNPNLHIINSNMKGYSSGRYRIEITKLGRKVEGKSYKISMYWTPYNPDNLVFKGRFNTYEELTGIIKEVNKDLLDTSRTYN